MFVQITNIGRWHNGQQAQPQTICAKPAVRTIVANKGNEDTLPS
jgi:hypothetical protein